MYYSPILWSLWLVSMLVMNSRPMDGYVTLIAGYIVTRVTGKKQLMRGPARGTPPAKKMLGNGPNPLSGIHREIAILKKCEHDNIVCLKEVIDDNESPEQNIYLVFELMDKGQVQPTGNCTYKIHYSGIRGIYYFGTYLLGK